MNYEKAINHVKSALKFGIDPSLEPISKLCEAVANPQSAYSCIQIAGTNGKSSTSRMIAALLHACGKRVGLYTSPHLVEYTERIEINGKIVDKQLFADGIEAAICSGRACGVEPTEFELLTAAAFWIFAHECVDVAVLECGLGGRWDATSVCVPKLAVITGIGLDHIKILGDTVEKIAAEKAAIIKPGSIAVLANGLEAREIFVERAQDVGAKYIDADSEVSMPYLEALSHMPSYQVKNAATALTAVNVFEGKSLDEGAEPDFAKALSSLVIPGRFEVLKRDPLLLIDAAHNPQSAAVLSGELAMRGINDTLILGVLEDKDCNGIVEALVPHFQHVIVTQSTSPRALPAEELAKLVCACGKEPQLAPSVGKALEVTRNVNAVATGSITIAGEVKAYFCGTHACDR